MSDIAQKFDLDLRGTICPMAFVKLRLFVDQMPDGETVRILYEDSKANEPLARSTIGIGHEVLSNEPAKNYGDDGTSLKILTIRVRG